MSAHKLHTALLRPSILYIVRAAGFRGTRSAVVDVLVNLAARYMLLLASATAANCATQEHYPLEPQLEDVRVALEQCAAFKPQRHATEEVIVGEEDLRGVQGFIDWITGDAHHEIRRIAGRTRAGDEGPLGGIDVAAPAAREDYLTVMKRKHGKMAEESRFRGTVVGVPAPEKPLRIQGGPAHSIQTWARQRDTVRTSSSTEKESAVNRDDPAPSPAPSRASRKATT